MNPVNTGFASVIGIGQSENIHPPNMREVGRGLRSSPAIRTMGKTSSE